MVSGLAARDTGTPLAVAASEAARGGEHQEVGALDGTAVGIRPLPSEAQNRTAVSPHAVRGSRRGRTGASLMSSRVCLCLCVCLPN